MAQQTEKRKSRDRFERWYNLGYSDQQIADKCETSRGSVVNWRYSRGLPPDNNRPYVMRNRKARAAS